MVRMNPTEPDKMTHTVAVLGREVIIHKLSPLLGQSKSFLSFLSCSFTSCYVAIATLQPHSLSVR